MSRADWVTAFATAVIAGIAWFVSGPKFAIASIAVGLTGLFVIHLLGRREGKQLPEKSATSELSMKESFNPTFTQTGPTIHVNVATPPESPTANHDRTPSVSHDRTPSLAESIAEHSLGIGLERSVRVELTPSQGQSERMLLAVKNLGRKQRFRAQCEIIAQRNTPNPTRGVVLNLGWQIEGIKDMPIRSYESCNLAIASAGYDHDLEWMRILGISEEPETRWTRHQTRDLPEYDLEISIFGDQSDRPHVERFTLKAGTTCALEMIKIRSDSPAERQVSESDPRIYLVDIADEGDPFFPETPFIVENRGGEVAHSIQIQPITFGDRKIVFPLCDNLPKGEKTKILPTIEDTDMNKHCILSVLREAWNAAGMRDGAKDFLEFPFTVDIVYESFNGNRRIETSVELTYSYVQQKWKREHGGKWPYREYKIFNIQKTTFKVLVVN